MENLLGYNGVRFSAKINDTPVSGKIRVEDGMVYLCQNEKAGACCDDRSGYKHSWYVGAGDSDKLKDENVTDLKLFSTASEIEQFKDWNVGDVLKYSRNGFNANCTVIFRSGEVVILKDKDNVANGPYTCDEIYNNGWRLDAEPVEDEKGIVEVTLDKIAELMKVPVDCIRVKN